MKHRSSRLRWFGALYVLSLTAFTLVIFAIRSVFRLLA
jgi:hypothetical protein